MASVLGREHVVGVAKAELSDADPSHDPFVRTLHDLHAPVQAILRKNQLDWFLCNVRDCLYHGRQGYGYQVYEGGQVNWKGCQSRREVEWNNETKAPGSVATASSAERVYVPDPGKLLAALRNLHAKDEDLLQRWRSFGLASSPVVWFEDLTAFEYDRKDLPTSVQAWAKVLEGLGVEMTAQRRDEVKAFL